MSDDASLFDSDIWNTFWIVVLTLAVVSIENEAHKEVTFESE